MAPRDATEGDTFRVPNGAKARRGQEQTKRDGGKDDPVMPPTLPGDARPEPEESNMSLSTGEIRFNLRGRIPPYPDVSPDGSLMG